MRRLMLVRHAKSDWPEGVTDRERPLAARGHDAASRLAAYMASEHLVPDLALVSAARRAQETWALLAPAFAAPLRWRLEPRLYEAPPERLAAIVREAAVGVGSLLVLGHNPGLGDLARRLVGSGERQSLARLRRKFPTAGLAVIDCPIDGWRDLAKGDGRLDRFVTPAMLGGEDD